jgi:iron complex outermembrane receptor protein
MVSVSRSSGLILLFLVLSLVLKEAGATVLVPQASGSSFPEVIDLDPMVIIGQADLLDPGTLPLSATSPEWNSLSLARKLTDLPGISLASRGAWADEPVIRGLGFDRVATTLNGLRLPNASPTRTHAPVGQLSGLAFQSVAVSRFLPSFDAGPPVSGGWISLESKYAESNAGDSTGQPRPQLVLNWFPDRDGTRWLGAFEQAGKPVGISVSLDGSRFGNYTSGDGAEVPAHHESHGASFSLSHGRESGWSHSVDGIYRRQGFTENASLPLDTDNGQFWALTSVHTVRPSDKQGALRLRFGYSETDATLDNRHRPAAPVSVLTDTFASSLHADLKWSAHPENDAGLTLGIDGNQDRRDAVRRRGTVSEDAIWPDIQYRQAGAYLQSRSQLTDRLRLRMGARFDYAASKAGVENKTAFGQSLLSLYSRYNGTVFEETRVTDTILSANALLTFRLSSSVTAYCGAGTSGQIPPPTERYRAFLNALGGGFEVGNPALAPERKHELAAGAILETNRLSLQADLYFFKIDDFIWRQRIGDTEGLLPLDPPQPVFGYRNVSAAFHGLEVRGTWQIQRNLKLPFSLAWSRAELRESGPGYSKGTALPEIPPANASVGLIYSFTVKSARIACRWQLHYAADGENELPELNPLYADTPSHTRHDFSLTLNQGESITVELSLLNCFDKNYTPYLNPPVSSIRPGSGDLLPGDRIPGPGREVALSCRVQF